MASAVGWRDVAFTAWYIPFATLLLAVGLYGSTSGICLHAFRRHLRTILLAVSLGVLLKASLIAGVLLMAFHDPALVVLAMAVAQIDPLSVAAIGRRGTMSSQARSLLAAWASFDDPITMVLTLQLLAVLGSRVGAPGQVAPEGMAGGWGGFGLDLLGSVTLAGGLAGGWWCVQRWRARRAARNAGQRRCDTAEIVLLLVGTAVAVPLSLLLGLAVAGLFLRPRLLRARPGGVQAMSGLTTGAFYAAVVLLGLVSAGGIDLVRGTVLGAAAFAAQIVVGALLTARMPGDRLRLSLAQQNGITAILLGLIIEPVLPGSLGVIAPAILVVNVLYLAANTLADVFLPPPPPGSRLEAAPVEQPTPSTQAPTGDAPAPRDASVCIRQAS